MPHFNGVDYTGQFNSADYDKQIITSQEISRLLALAFGEAAQMKKRLVSSEMLVYVFVKFLDKKYVTPENRAKALAELKNGIEQYVPDLVGPENILFTPEISQIVTKAALAIDFGGQTEKMETAHIIAAVLKMPGTLACYVLNKYIDFTKYFFESCDRDLLRDVTTILTGAKPENFDVEKAKGGRSWMIKISGLYSICNAELEKKLADIQLPSDKSMLDIIKSVKDGDKIADIFEDVNSVSSENIVSLADLDELVEFCESSGVSEDYLDGFMNYIRFHRNRAFLLANIMKKKPFGCHMTTGKIDGDFVTEKDYRYAISNARKMIEKRNTISVETDRTGAKNRVNKKAAPENLEALRKRYDKLMNEICPCVSDKVEYIEVPFIGRKEELDLTLRILCRRNKNNPIHVGEPGVGKTALLTGLIQSLKTGKFPKALKNAKIYQLNITKLVAGTRMRGDFEERLNNVIAALNLDARMGIQPIVYIDEIHTVIKAGDAQGGLGLGQLLKQSLEEGNIRYIGSTTTAEYDTIFSMDKALDRRFKKVEIKEPTEKECFEILKGAKGYYERYHHIDIPDTSLKAIITLTSKYIKDKALPDKAIDIIDESGALYSVHPKEVPHGVVTVDVVESIIAKNCGIPVETVSESEADKIMKLSDEFKKNIFGQDSACAIVDSCIKVGRSGLEDANKPIASLLFVGPTGVGKTELAKVVANTLNIPLIRLNMSEYKEEYSVSKLIGSAPGYVGYNEGGSLVRKIKENPFSVLLLDEIEKAHPGVFDLFLQVMDNAELTDSQGRKADFQNVILIMTSNAGARSMNNNRLGFNPTGESMKLGKDAMTAAVKETFRPEFLNRLTEVVQFDYLGNEVAEKIVKKRFDELRSKLAAKGIKLNVKKEAIQYVVKKGVGEEYGAREIARIMDKEVKVKIADLMFSKNLTEGSTVYVSCQDDELQIKSRCAKTDPD